MRHGVGVPTIHLPFHPPLAIDPLRRFVLAHAITGLDRVDAGAGRLTRAVPDGAGGWMSATVDLSAPAPGLPPTITVGFAAGAGAGAGGATEWSGAAGTDRLAGATRAVRRWLDLDRDPTGPDEALAADPMTAPLVAARPGLRVPGSLDGFETLVLAVLGQQVSLAAARTLAARLVAAFGAPHAGGLRLFPTAAAMAASTPEQLQVTVGTTRARAATLHGVAVAVADGLDVSPGVDPVRLRRDLSALPGIGTWTVEIIAMRVLRDPDAFLATDLVLQRVLGVKTGPAALARAQAWRPWRAYALLHLWTGAVFA